jgi:hypothetical protein
LNPNVSEADFYATWTVATSRFEATTVAIWSDSPSIQHDRVAPAGVLDSDVIPEGVQYVLATDGLSVVVNIQEVITRYGCMLLYLSFQP